MRSFTTHSVPVAGGMLRAIEWGPGTGRATVIAIHGITANSRSMIGLAEAVDPAVRLVAVDLRGRGDSCDLPGPYGMEAHARDVESVADHLGVDEIVVLGHSMGAVVSTMSALLLPDRVAGLVLVDGGLPLPIPADVDPGLVLGAVLGPALARLSMTFDSMSSYFDFWRQHPAFTEWSLTVEAYLRYDIGGEEPALRPRASEAAITEDGADLIANHSTTAHLRRVSQPIEVLRVDRGIMNEPPGMIPPGVYEPVVAAMPNLAMTSSSAFNHYSVLTTEAGAATVNEALERLLARIS